MEMFNLNEMRQVLESQMDNPVELNKMGVRMLEVMDEMNKTVIQMDDKLEAELKEWGCKVPLTEEASAAPSLPTTPLRFPLVTTPSAPIRPRKIRGFSRWGFKPVRLNFDSPPSSPEKVVTPPVSPAASNEIPIPQAPLRPRRICRIDMSNFRPQRLNFDSSPERESDPAEFKGPFTPAQKAPSAVPNAPMRPKKTVSIDRSTVEPIPLSFDNSPQRSINPPDDSITPVCPSLQMTPSAPVRSRNTVKFDLWDMAPIRLCFDSPPPPESALGPTSGELCTPDRQRPMVIPHAPIQPNRFIKMDHFTASPIRLSFDSPDGSPQHHILQQNQDHSSDVLCTPKVQKSGYMDNLIGAPVRPERTGRISVFEIPFCSLNRDSSPERLSESDLPTEPATPYRESPMVIPQTPKKIMNINAWDIEPIPLYFDSDDE